MRTVAIGGEPATGKTTLARALLSDYTVGQPLRYGKLEGTRYHATDEQGDLFVLGHYDHEYGGTDRLPMDVVTDARPFLDELRGMHPDATLFFEGDRLFNASYLALCDDLGALHAYVLTCPQPELDRRHDARGDDQDDSWLKGRASKYQSLADNDLTTTLTHATQDDHEAAQAEIREYLPTPVT